MSSIIVTVTSSNKKSIYAASSVQENSAPDLKFLGNNKYVSFNADQTVTITAGTYSQQIAVKNNLNNAF